LILGVSAENVLLLWNFRRRPSAMFALSRGGGATGQLQLQQLQVSCLALDAPPHFVLAQQHAGSLLHML
jgi:hypothetical protein